MKKLQDKLKILEDAYQRPFDSRARQSDDLLSNAQRRNDGADPRLNRSLGDSFSRVQAELQGANYEKNRLKETIQSDEQFKNLKSIVDRLYQTILTKQRAEFTESDIVLFRQLFGALPDQTQPLEK